MRLRSLFRTLPESSLLSHKTQMDGFVQNLTKRLVRQHALHFFAIGGQIGGRIRCPIPWHTYLGLRPSTLLLSPLFRPLTRNEGTGRVQKMLRLGPFSWFPKDDV